VNDSCRGRVERALERIAGDAHLNAWSYLAENDARQAAEDSDARLAAGAARSPIEGRLVALKANIAVRGWPHDGGLLVRRGLRADHDAPVIERLRAAGAILLGQTRMDAGALGAEGRSINGPIRNPLRPSHSVGGSSGGSAAAIAAGHVGLAIGTDTIGSVRIPASFCGIASLKPTPGSIDTTGVLPVHERFDHVGPMTARAADLDPLRALLANRNATSRVDAPDVGRMVIGHLVDAEDIGATPAVLSHYARGLEVLRSLGAQLVPIKIAAHDPGRVRRAIFSLCEYEMWLQHRDALDRDPGKYSPQLTAMLRFGGSLDETRRAEFGARIERFAATVHELMQPLHALVTPTTPGQAFDFSGPTPLDLADLTAIATAAGLPAVSVPLPTLGDLPAGLQIIGRAGDDALACRLATAFEQARDDLPRGDWPRGD
jgi:aspartyl-tRNA(Asn)/glutamyl-tRNA(Gln) amidotransferase subunit A